MADVLIRPTQPGDAGRLAANLRASDAAELHAYDGRTEFLLGIQSAVERSTLCWSAFIDGEMAAILGVAPLVGEKGSPWMLGTPVLNHHARILVANTGLYIGKMLQAYPHLVNFVHARNATSIRWLRRLGFTLHNAEPYGTQGEPFHFFEKRA